MKWIIKTMVSVICIAATMVSFSSCGYIAEKKQQMRELQEKQQERERVANLTKTESGLRSYLSGKTFVWDDTDARAPWVKIIFLDENSVIAYQVYDNDRSWGEGRHGYYDLRRENGTFNVILKEKTEYGSSHPMLNWFKVLQWNGEIIIYSSLLEGEAKFRECEANYTPSHWR